MKRIYSTDGKQSAPAWIVRTILVLALPFIAGWAFFTELLSGAARAFRDAWHEARAEIGEFKRWWNRAK